MSYLNEQELLKRAARDLGEFFDSVKIFATVQDEEDDEKCTMAYEAGSGNQYAVYGQVKEWLLKEEAEMETPPEKD